MDASGTVDVRTRNILLLGATSGIARAIARRLAEDSARQREPLGLILAGRDLQELERLAADVRTRSGTVTATRFFDAARLETLPAFFADGVAALPGGLQGVVLCHGYMAEQKVAEADPETARRMIDINFTSAVILLERAAAHFESQKVGFIAAISSVAGDRGRQSNYLYGSTKGALTTYLQGLRNRLHRSGIPVLTIKPGFVDTAMTRGIVKPNSPLMASPEQVAADISRAISRRKDVIYTRWFWRIIMGIIRSIPEPLFKRLKL